ncbi:MAG TPA: tetratricopeptide repeat protein [Tepidisphaeraceae bacterium]|jgi:predicted O-linked N-acetylglucosamine transferase (SPINDLY family)|nr:tetratricopeptide repeat protein [Tepidisphaeraceae bacterium]
MASIQDAYDEANRLHQAGDLRQAAEIYRRILDADPSHADSMHYIGVIALQSGRAAQAIDIFTRSIALRPTAANYYTNLGAAYQSLGRYAEAIAAHETAVRLQPGSADAVSGLAFACYLQGDVKRTERYCLEGLRLNPDHAELWNTQGNIRRMQGRMAEAAAMFGKAVQFNPRHALAHNNLACTLQVLRKPQEAIAHYRQALAMYPDYAEAHSNLATLLHDMGDFEQAESHLREAARLQPNLAVVRKNLGGVLQSQGKFDEAIASFRAAEALAPTESPASSNILLCMNYDPKIDTPALFAEHLRWARKFGAASTFGPSAAHDRDPDRRLRIGYVSPNLNVHPLTHFFEPILTHHDPAQVDVICYSDMSSPDATTARLKAASPGWRDVFAQSDVELANLIRSDGIDILVDLAGHTSRGRVRMFAHKPAPVQVNYLGYPYTSGLKAMDYRLTDSIADPPGEPVSYTEELVRLPGGFCCFDPGPGAPDVGPSPAARNRYVTFGSLHNLLRLNHSVLEAWSEILRAAPTSRLLIFRDTLQRKGRNDLTRFFKEQGISPDRIDLQNQTPKGGSFLSVYHGIDISLDTFPWSGHTTSCQALWMGVAVVTLYGARHAGRMVASVLHHAGLERFIAQSPRGYVKLAADLAGDIRALAELRGRLRAQVSGSALCDYAGFTRNLEQTYRRMWRRRCAAAE